MSVISRCGSSMLLRVVPSTRAAVLPTSQSPAALLCLRIPSKPQRFYSSAENPQPRSNPLVGNYNPTSSPKPRTTDDTPATSQAEPATDSPSPEASRFRSNLTTASLAEAFRSEPAETSKKSNVPPSPPPPASFAEALNLPPSSKPAGAPQKPESKLKFPEMFDIHDIIANKTSQFYEGEQIKDPMQQPRVFTKAVTGRTIFVGTKGGPNTAQTPVIAIKMLHRLCNKQKIRSKWHSQKFHERPGLKKKRLRMSRWRERFKIGFKATVSRVLELRKQGW